MAKDYKKPIEVVKKKGDPGEPRFVKEARTAYQEAKGEKEKAIEVLIKKVPELSAEIARVYIEFVNFEQNREAILADL